MSFIRIVQRRQNCLYIAIPKVVAHDANIKRGDYLIAHQINGRQLIYTRVQTDLKIPLAKDESNQPYEE